MHTTKSYFISGTISVFLFKWVHANTLILISQSDLEFFFPVGVVFKGLFFTVLSVQMNYSVLIALDNLPLSKN